VKYNRMKSGEIGAASLMVKPSNKDVIEDHSLNINNLYLDDLKVKIDDKNNKYLLFTKAKSLTIR
ncbi:MAG TPA: hypothetical protein PLS00_16185, partial [Niabella sp.]|nr:hypothetical protein [Niabella sp.]